MLSRSPLIILKRNLPKLIQSTPQTPILTFSRIHIHTLHTQNVSNDLINNRISMLQIPLRHISKIKKVVFYSNPDNANQIPVKKHERRNEAIQKKIK